MRSTVMLIGSLALVTSAVAAEPTATARLISAKGKSVGTARFTEAPGGLLIDVEVRGLVPAAQAAHIHAVGTCDDASAGFKAAQGHVKDGNVEHGLRNRRGFEAGDLPNPLCWRGRYASATTGAPLRVEGGIVESIS